MSKHAYYDNIGYLRNFDRAKAHVIATWRSTNGGEPHDLERILRVDAADGPLYLEATRNYASGKVRYYQISEREANQVIAAWREIEADRLTHSWSDWQAMYSCAFA